MLLFPPLAPFQKVHTRARCAPAPGELATLTPPLPGDLPHAPHIALTTMEGSRPTSEERQLLTPAPHFCSLNSLRRARKSNIGYSIFPCNLLPEEVR